MSQNKTKQIINHLTGLSEKAWGRIVAWGVFTILLITYWLSIPPTVSFWDCPEYTSAAWLLEVGHPPGNPVWMLVERVITMLAPSGKYAALLINLSSGVFTAFAGFFLALSIYAGAGWIMRKLPSRPWPRLTRCVAAATGALAFGWCDSSWYSAVEAEVYAMSIFMTALCVWLMIKWAACKDRGQATRLLVLIAYLFGLSIGIHQLNLLCIPALAIIWGIRRGVTKWWKWILLFIISCALVGFILMGIMPGTIIIAGYLELFAVNTLNLPFLSGVTAFVVLTAAILLALILVTARYRRLRRLNICVWMLAMLLTGYSAYAIIPIRGDIDSPANAFHPGDPFSFASYQGRESYGAAPLLYGHTPYSKNMILEEYADGDTIPRYTRHALEKRHAVRIRKTEGAKMYDPYGFVSEEDSLYNSRLIQRPGDAYLTRGYAAKPVYTPELNMWFPRIHSRDPIDIACFADWAGMDTASMTRVAVTEAIDTAGNFVTKMRRDGKRRHQVSYRPTYLQSLRMLLNYQCGYMYFRYLLWNFSGRQNDIHSTGEVEHGNFITGITPIDNLMLGAEHALPASAGKDNPGRNRYFMLPLLLGIIGIFWMGAHGRRAARASWVICVLFVMSGLAIVVYLNQSPGEPRERDYSFLGSYYAYAVWIGFGTIALLRGARKYAPYAAIIPAAIVIWMAVENWDDHDRTGRTAAAVIPANYLNSLEPNAIVIVDGDNMTFPLWYAIEVEGLRPDVRVINLAYLGVPTYYASLMNDWRDAKGVPSTLRPGDIQYNALLFAGTDKTANPDSVVPATEMLRSLAASRDGRTSLSHVWLDIPGEGKIRYPLANLIGKKGSKNFEFRRLALFDILASNGASPQPRPVYWQRTLSSKSLLGLDSLTSLTLNFRRLGRPDVDTREKEYLASLSGMARPNGDNDADVYMDATPAGQIAIQRAGLVLAARDMLDNGRIASARRLAWAADTLFGNDSRTFLASINADSTFNTRRELAGVLNALADSLLCHPEIKIDTDEANNLHKRADRILSDYEKSKQDWQRYKRTLPPRLRLKMSK